MSNNSIRVGCLPKSSVAILEWLSATYSDLRASAGFRHAAFRAGQIATAFPATKTTGTVKITTRTDTGGTSTRGTREVTAAQAQRAAAKPRGMPTTKPMREMAVACEKMITREDFSSSPKVFKTANSTFAYSARREKYVAQSDQRQESKEGSEDRRQLGEVLQVGQLERHGCWFYAGPEDGARAP